MLEDWSTLLPHGEIKHLHDFREQLITLSRCFWSTDPTRMVKSYKFNHRASSLWNASNSFQKTLCPTKQENKTTLFYYRDYFTQKFSQGKFYSTRTCGNSSLQQNYVWGKTTEKQLLFSSIKRREWDSLDKIAMLDIRNGRFKCVALNKTRRQLQNACSPDEVKWKPGAGLSVIYEQHFHMCQKLKQENKSFSS